MKRVWFWIVLILPAVLVIVVWNIGGQTRIDIGSPADEQVVRNFHARENNTLDTYRWSRLNSHVRLPSYHGSTLLGLRGSPASDGTQATLQLGADLQVPLPTYSGTLFLRNYIVFVPAQSSASGWQPIAITAQPPLQPIETRPLGLVLTDLSLRSLDGPLNVPPLILWGILAVLPLVFQSLFKLLGLPGSMSVGLSLALGGLATGIWGYRPYWIQPFLPIGLATLLLYAGLVWWLHTKIRHDTTLTPMLKLVLVLIVFGGVVPLYQYQYYGFFSLESTLHWHNWPIAAALLAMGITFVPHHARPWFMGALALLIVAYGLVSYSNAFVDDFADDFKVLFRGPRSFLNGNELYDLEAIRQNSLNNLYKYPPFFVLLMGGLTDIPFGPAIQIWRGINLLLFFVGAGLLWRWSKQPLRSWSTVGLAYLVFAFQQFADVLGYGQVDMIVVFAGAGAMLALASGRWGLWGGILALPVAIKLYPAYLIMHAIVWRRWRGVLSFGGTFLILWALGIAVLGWGIHETYLRDVLPFSGGGTAWVENQTVNGFLNRFVTLPISLTPETGGMIRWLTYAGALLVTLLTVWRSRRMTIEAGFGLWIVSMLIILPVAWIHYQVILLIPFYQMLVRLDRQPDRRSWSTLVFYALAWSLLCYGNQWTFFNKTYHGPLWTLLLSYKFYGLILLWAAIAFDPSASQVMLDENDTSLDSRRFGMRSIRTEH